MKQAAFHFISLGLLALGLVGCNTVTAYSNDDSPYLNPTIGLYHDGQGNVTPVYELGYYHARYDYYTTVRGTQTQYVAAPTMVKTSCCNRRTSTCCTTSYYQARPCNNPGYKVTTPVIHYYQGY